MKATSSRTPETVFKAIVEAACEVRGRAALSHYPSRRLWAARLHERLKSNLELLGQLQQEVAPTSTSIREKGAVKGNVWASSRLSKRRPFKGVLCAWPTPDSTLPLRSGS